MSDHLSCRAAFLATGALLIAGPAFAQSQSAELEEIVVSARRVEENLQQVPITISAFTAEMLEKRDIRSTHDLSNLTPALDINGFRGVVQFPFIRGIQGVATYFADAPVGQSGTWQYFDIDSVAVLLGPQGTTFGNSSNAGAIVYSPKKPGEAVEGFVRGNLGNYDRRSLEGAVSFPVIADRLFLRLGAQRVHTDGYQKDLTSGRTLGSETYSVGRVSAVFRPVESVENYTLFNYYNFRGTRPAAVLEALRPNSPVTQIFGAAITNYFAEQQALGPYRVRLDMTDGNIRTRQFNLVNTTSWEFADGFTLKNIFGYQSLNDFSVSDSDGGPFPVVQSYALQPRAPAVPTWSEEVQLLGKLFSDRLSVILGTFHTETHTPRAVPVYSNTLGGLSAQITRNSFRSRAVYAQGTVDLSDAVEGLSFTAGFRYTWDIARQANQRLTLPTLVSNRDLSGEGRFKAPSHTLSLQYQARPDTMLFVTNSKGYRTGGLQLTAPTGFQTFGPESLNNVEAGIKTTTDFGGVRLRANLAAHYGWYSDIQVPQFISVQVNPLPAPASLVQVTTNAAKAHIKGADAEITAVFDRLELAGAVALNKNVYDRYRSLTLTGAPVDLSSTRFIRLPKWKYNLKGTFHALKSDRQGDVALTAVWSQQDFEYNAAKPKAQILPTDIKPGLSQLDLILDWTDVAGLAGLDLQLYVNNLAENKVATSGFGVYDQLGYYGNFPAVPRMYGARVKYAFE